MNLDCKVLLLQTYYELSEFEALDSLIATSRQFIRRQRSMGYLKSTYLLFLRYLNKLSKLKAYDEYARIQFKRAVQEERRLMLKPWFNLDSTCVAVSELPPS